MLCLESDGLGSDKLTHISHGGCVRWLAVLQNRMSPWPQFPHLPSSKIQIIFRWYLTLSPPNLYLHTSSSCTVWPTFFFSTAPTELDLDSSDSLHEKTACVWPGTCISMFQWDKTGVAGKIRLRPRRSEFKVKSPFHFFVLSCKARAESLPSDTWLTQGWLRGIREVLWALWRLCPKSQIWGEVSWRPALGTIVVSVCCDIRRPFVPLLFFP